MDNRELNQTEAPFTRDRSQRIRKNIFPFWPPVYTETMKTMVSFSVTPEKFENALQSGKI